MGNYLLQTLQDPDSGGRTGDGDGGLMLGTDKSRGYCLEMICADFLAGASLEDADQSVLLNSLSRLIKFLPDEQRQHFFSQEAHEAR